MILEAAGRSEAMVEEAKGKARAIELVFEAQAFGINQIKNADPNEGYIKLRSLEAAEKMADGQATKLIIPSNLQDLSSLLAAGKEILSND